MFGICFDWESIRREHERKEQEFRRLLCDPSATVPEMGDTVIVAAGLLGRGFDWVRLEAEVIGLADTSVKVRFVGRDFGGVPDEEWIHPALITDVIRRQKVAEPGAVDTPISEPQSDA